VSPAGAANPLWNPWANDRSTYELYRRRCRREAHPYLDEGKRHIRVYHNTYPLSEVADFMSEHGYEVTPIRDERTGDGVETVVDVPHRWRILLGERTGA
jgi:hypothetical protein